MKISTMVGERKKEIPQGVVAKSHELLLRAGFIKQVSNGIYSLFTPAIRVQNKIMNIIRDEMNKADGQEVLFPAIMPKELWEESGRYSSIGNEMFRFKDRTGHDMLLGMTHEEAAVHLAKNTIKSYDQLPCMIFQLQNKFRDEQRPRAGLLRVKEFIMNDAYSFHENAEDLNSYYQKMYNTYHSIFSRFGLKNFLAVESDTGMMGGSKTHEFMLLTDIGEDELAVCNSCSYRANVEVAKSVLSKNTFKAQKQELIYTPNIQTIKELEGFFNLPAQNFCKAVVYWGEKTKKYFVVFIRADLEVSDIKLENLAGEELVITDDLSKSNLQKGFIGPNFLPNENVVSYFDISLQNEENLVVGANKEGYHIKGFSFNRDAKNIKFNQLYEVADGHKCIECQNGIINIRKGVEIGHVFALGDKYTKSMNMTIHNRNGQLVNPLMGCYGIGVGRAISSIVEESNDEKGIVWPVSVAPWHIYLAPLKIELPEVKHESEKLYQELKNKGYEVIFDDRQVSAGVKFAESELMGIPVRIVISPRTIESGLYEIAVRNSGEKFNVAQNILFETLDSLLKGR